MFGFPTRSINRVVFVFVFALYCVALTRKHELPVLPASISQRSIAYQLTVCCLLQKIGN